MKNQRQRASILVIKKLLKTSFILFLLRKSFSNMETRLLLDTIYVISGKGFVITMDLNFAWISYCLLLSLQVKKSLKPFYFITTDLFWFISRVFYIPFLNFYRYRTETTRNATQDLPFVGKYSPSLWLVYFTSKSSGGW